MSANRSATDSGRCSGRQPKKEGAGTMSGPQEHAASLRLEAGAEAAEEVAAANAVDRAARADAGQAERGVAVERIVDARVEGKIAPDVHLEPEVVVEHAGVVQPVRKVRVVRRAKTRRGAASARQRE